MSTIIGGKIVVVLTGVKDCGGRGGGYDTKTTA